MKRIAIALLLISTLMFASGVWGEEAAAKGVTGTTKGKAFSAPATTSSAPSAVTTPVKKKEKEKAETQEQPTEQAVSELKLPEKENKGPQYTLSGYYRARFLGLWDVNMGVSNDPNVVDADHIPSLGAKVFYHKLRLEPTLKFNKFVTFKFQLDVFNDQPYGLSNGTLLAMDTSSKEPNVILKRAWGVILLPVGILEFGRIPSNFGFGISDNNGNAPDELFGDAHYGDTFDRILFATKPLGPQSDLVVAVLADKIIEGLSKFDDIIHPVAGGENCSEVICNKGDDLNQTSFVLLYNMGSGESDNPNYQGPIVIGNNFTYRWQNSTSSKIYNNDFFLKVNLGLLYTNFESVVIKGTTKALPAQGLNSNNQIIILYPKVTVDSAGWMWNFGLNTDEYRFHFEVGYASGDVPGKPIVPGVDQTFTQFSFHPDYNVGLIMFEYAMDAFARDNALATEKNIELLLQSGKISQDVANQLIASLPLLLTHGAVSNALYINPRFTYKLFDDNLKITAAYLYAKANSPRVLKNNVELYNYGHEIDLGVKYRYEKNVIFGLEGGVFFPGDYFRSVVGLQSGKFLDPDNVYAVQGKITIVFGDYAGGEEY